ncbi:MAG TPA: M48 family metallopeptidase [Bacteroidia bacterium]|nr:M48 family metallopeptidase [Bacteroidia bacterium]
MRRRLPGLFFIFFAFPAFAQHAPLEPKGPMPAYFQCPVYQQVDKDIARRQAQGDVVSDQEKDFMYESSYFMQQRMFSGYVLYNDSISDYISSVGAEVLKDDTATLHKLHFYAYKDADPNAYTSSTGTVLITLGLLAQLENEAQLAFILCHEITHFRQQHMLKGYLNREELKNQKGKTPMYLLQSSYYSYNQEQELEADRLGFELFMKSGYAKKEALRSFDVLEYADLPFDDVPFDTMFFNKDYMKIPPGYFMKEVDPIYTDDNYDDLGSTHPNVRKRRMALMTTLDTVQNKDGSLFMVSKDNFLASRENARYEICRLYLQDRNYPAAVYCSYMMLQRHPGDSYLEKIVGESLYEIAAYYQSGKKTGFMIYDFWGFFGTYGGKYDALNRSGYYHLPDFKDNPGQQEQIFHLFHEIEPDEMTVLALSYNWTLHKKNPSDSLLSTLCDSLFSMLVNNQNLHLSYFSTVTPDEAKAQLQKDSLSRVQETGETGDSKFSRLDKFKLNSGKERFTKFAFVEMLKDTEFVSRFKYYTDNRRSLVYTPDYSTYDFRTKKERKADEKEEKNYGFGITKIIVAGPDYEYYKQKNRNDDPDMDYRMSEDGQTRMTGVIKAQASAAGVNAIILNPMTMDSTAGDSLSDLAVLNEWFYEKLQHGNHSWAWTVNDQSRADSIAKKYGTRYVMFTSVEADYYRKIQHPVLFAMSCAFVVPAVRAFIPREKFFLDAAILDLKTGEVINVKHQLLRKGKEGNRTTEFYRDLFSKMVKPKREKPANTHGRGGKPVDEDERGM